MSKLIWIFLFTAVVFRIGIYHKTRPIYTVGTKLRITSRVSSEPIRYSNSQYIKLKGFKIYLPLYPEIYYGDRIVVEGIVEGDELKKATLIGVKETQNILYTLRKKLITKYFLSLPQPHAALVAGVTIGSKASIPASFWEALKKTSTAHVVVASGMNVTLVSQFLISFLALILPRKKALPFALLGVWGYALLSGFDAPIIRASIMGSLVFVAQELGRLNFSLRTLFITIFAMLIIRPDWIEDVGFQLSFAATLSLILFESKMEKFLRGFFKVGGWLPSLFRKDFSTSLAAQVGVVPILYFGFGQFNILSPVVNVLVLWTIVPITVIGMIGGILGIIFEPLGKAALLLTYPLTSWFIWIVGLFG